MPPQTRDWWRADVCAEIVSRGRHVTKHLWEYWHANMLRNVSDISSELIILEPEILGNHNINTGTTLLLKTIVN